MRNRNSKTLGLIVVASTVLIACNPLNKMVKRQAEVNYELTPNPVEMHGDSIAITFNGSFPVKYFNKMGKQHIPQQLSCLICIY